MSERRSGGTLRINRAVRRGGAHVTFPDVETSCKVSTLSYQGAQMPRSAGRLALIAGFKEAIGLVDENGDEFVERDDAIEGAAAEMSGPSRDKIRRIAQEMADGEAERWDASVAAEAAKSTPRRRLP